MTSTQSEAIWVEPPPATRGEKIVAISTVSAGGVIMALAVGHLFMSARGLVPFNTGEWGFPDFAYLMLMVLLSALILVHAALGEDALRPRTMIALASTVGAIGTLLALGKGWLMLVGAGFSEARWMECSAFAALAISILPFALPFTAGVILLRNDFEAVAWRVRAVAIAVTATAFVIVLAALIPRWARLAEVGAW